MPEAMTLPNHPALSRGQAPASSAGQAPPRLGAAKHLRPKREKVFGDGDPVPLDRNAKARIEAYVQGYNARMKQPRQHHGPITRAFVDVLKTLLWTFHNSRSGLCFPSYERIAEAAKCNRDTVYEAIKALEFAGIITWVNRIVRTRVLERDLFGRMVGRCKVIRTSNAYHFHDPQQAEPGRKSWAFRSKSENPSGTQNQEFNPSCEAPAQPVCEWGDAAEARKRLAEVAQARQAQLWGAAMR